MGVAKEIKEEGLNNNNNNMLICSGSSNNNSTDASFTSVDSGKIEEFYSENNDFICKNEERP